MKNLFLLAALVLTGSATAQYYQDAENVDMLRHVAAKTVQRSEIVLPQVNGYNVYKADLHTHTIFSDAETTPEYRVREAFWDGLDVLAVTDHVEYRPYEGKMLNFLKGYVPEGTKAINTRIHYKAGDARGIQTDLNLSVELTKAAAREYGITIIPGTEVTRDPRVYGHYNALFTTDNNTIYDADPLVSLRNARKQGAIIMQNHPGWRRKNLEYLDFEIKAYGEGLIDGIEVMNGREFYPKIIDRAREKKFFVSANTDIHSTTSMDYRLDGNFRNMTLIFAKDKSLKSLRSAMEARRTLAYSFGTLAGDEQLLKDLFLASVKVEVVYTNDKGARIVRLTNTTSLSYQISVDGRNPLIIKPFSSIQVSVAKDKTLSFEVCNMWCGADRHPKIECKL